MCSGDLPARSLMYAVMSVRYSLAFDRFACLMYSINEFDAFCGGKINAIERQGRPQFSIQLSTSFAGTYKVLPYVVQPLGYRSLSILLGQV